VLTNLLVPGLRRFSAKQSLFVARPVRHAPALQSFIGSLLLILSSEPYGSDPGKRAYRKLESQCPVIRVVSMGRRNTQLEPDLY